ncbi:VOC family protein [Glaciihabitans sp. dw_435]|uniref:VOC family protein n=1 Tax=Glaciihabitans sp. dw_435 TaxID=2720081 RepID=UPI001BD2EB07|nr:VOC family protein [Glaciihabitans sp. dw_435]
MTEHITGRQFHDSDGVEDWRVVSGGAQTFFVTETFARGIRLINKIGEIAEAAGHHPNVDLRYGGVLVRVFTHDLDDLSALDVPLARAISVAARDLEIPADPSQARWVQIAIDALDIPTVLPFWAAAFGYVQIAEADLIDPLGRGPNIWFQQMDAPRPQRNRIHIDLYLPRDQAESRIAAALAAGGRVVNDADAPEWWTLADPEGNEVDIAPWPDDYAGD